MKSQFREVGEVELPYVNEEIQMIPFDLSSLDGIPTKFKDLVWGMLSEVKAVGTAYFTIHGKYLKEGNTLRRPAPHTDGNYEPVKMGFGVSGGGQNGWKVGENGAGINTDLHKRQYSNTKGGVILATNYASCLGWEGEYEGEPGVGGDCRHIKLDTPKLLKANTVYYGNNHFIHESIPVGRNVHRVFARVTLPEIHEYN